MPNLKGVKKRVKTSAKKEKANAVVKGAMKTSVKKLSKTTGNNEEMLKDSIKKINKALKKGVIKKNTAARKISRITKCCNKTK